MSSCPLRAPLDRRRPSPCVRGLQASLHLENRCTGSLVQPSQAKRLPTTLLILCGALKRYVHVAGHLRTPRGSRELLICSRAGAGVLLSWTDDLFSSFAKICVTSVGGRVLKYSAQNIREWDSLIACRMLRVVYHGMVGWEVPLSC